METPARLRTDKVEGKEEEKSSFNSSSSSSTSNQSENTQNNKASDKVMAITKCPHTMRKHYAKVIL
jgi:hypothetical protein